MKVLKTITVYKEDDRSININESDRDKYIKEGWSEIKPEVIKPVVIKPVVTKPSK